MKLTWILGSGWFLLIMAPGLPAQAHEDSHLRLGIREVPEK